LNLRLKGGGVRIVAKGHLRLTNSTPAPAIVRYAPLATKMVRRRERSDVPLADIPAMLAGACAGALPT
jgi:hypothetical protein